MHFVAQSKGQVKAKSFLLPLFNGQGRKFLFIYSTIIDDVGDQIWFVADRVTSPDRSGRATVAVTMTQVSEFDVSMVQATGVSMRSGPTKTADWFASKE